MECALLTCCWVAFSPVNSFSVFYARSVGLSMDTYGKYVAASYVCSLALAYFLGALADRFHPLRVSMVAIGLYGAVMLWGGFFADNARAFGLLFAAHTVLSGTYVTVAASLGQRLFPRLRFGQFASAQIAMQGVGLVLVPPIIGAIIDATGRDYRLTFLSGGLFAAWGTTRSIAGSWRSADPPAIAPLESQCGRPGSGLEFFSGCAVRCRLARSSVVIERGDAPADIKLPSLCLPRAGRLTPTRSDPLKIQFPTSQSVGHATCILRGFSDTTFRFAAFWRARASRAIAVTS